MKEKGLSQKPFEMTFKGNQETIQQIQQIQEITESECIQSTIKELEEEVIPAQLETHVNT